MSAERETGAMSEQVVHLPAPTSMPMVLALGVVLLGAGLMTHWAVSFLGAVLMAWAALGWAREVLPHEHDETVPVVLQVVEIKSSRTQVARLPVSAAHRKIVPLETFTLASGVKGGIAGGVAMLAPAELYGLVRYHSLWYPVNLLAAFATPGWEDKSVAFLSAFHLQGLLLAIVVHGMASLLVGLLYGAILPMFPRKPILTAGFLAPLFWTGILYATLEAVSPDLIPRIDWLWFVLSQVAFGLVAGFVVNLHVRVRTPQFQALPFYERAGLESEQNPFSDEDRPS